MTGRVRTTALAFFVALVGACLSAPPAAVAGTANGGLPGAPRANPLAGMQWGIYTGAYDGIYSAYRAAQGDTKRLLAKIALRSTAHWFGAWIRDTDAEASARRYIQSVTGGDSNLLAQIAVFRLDPWEQVACSTVPGAARQGSFRSWINGFARGIGDARAVLILQPDVPFALCSPGQRRWLDMLAYASGRFTALPHTTVYIDAGAAQWASVGQAASLLERAGVRHARGFALNTTEYDSTARELSFGAQILRRLGAAGIRGKHFVINTAENGAPFLNGQYPGDPSNPRVCASRHDRICATLGIPPTTRVADPRWGLSPQARSLAARYADAYLWIGRPWLASGAGAFDLHRALGLIKSSPF